MQATALDLITLAYRDIGILGLGETLSAELAQQGLDKLNMLVDGLRLNRGWLYQQVRTVVPLLANQATYTIGPGGDINLPRPDYTPDAAGTIINTNVALHLQNELPIVVLTDQEWQLVGMKTLQSTLIQGIYYDFSYNVAGRGLINVTPVPTVGTTALVLYLPGLAVDQFANYVTLYSLLPGYKQALYLNLALALATPAGRPVTPDMKRDAIRALAAVERTNARTPQLRADEVMGMARGGQWGWNYRTGSYQP